MIPAIFLPEHREDFRKVYWKILGRMWGAHILGILPDLAIVINKLDERTLKQIAIGFCQAHGKWYEHKDENIVQQQVSYIEMISPVSVNKNGQLTRNDFILGGARQSAVQYSLIETSRLTYLTEKHPEDD